MTSRILAAFQRCTTEERKSIARRWGANGGVDRDEISKLDESCISNPKPEIADWTRTSKAVQSEVSDFGFEMQDSSNFKIAFRLLCSVPGTLRPSAFSALSASGVALLWRRSSRHEVFVACGHQYLQRAETPHRVAVEALGNGAPAIRNDSWVLRGHPVDDRRCALRHDALQQHRRGGRRVRQRTLAIRWRRLQAWTTTLCERLETPRHCVLEE